MRSRLLSSPCWKREERSGLLSSAPNARGEADEYSDIDLVIIKDTEIPFPDRYTDFKGLFRVTRKALQILVYAQKEFDDMREQGNPFISEVVKDGIVIYEAESPGRS
jgi:hypothetical protein